MQIPDASQKVVVLLGLSDRPLPRSHVASILWPDIEEPRALGNLRSALWRLGSLTGGIVDCPGRFLWLARWLVIDYLSLLGLIKRVMAGLNPDRAEVDRLLDAQDLLPTSTDDWVILDRERIRQLRLGALERLCETLIREQRLTEAVEVGFAAAASDPLRESAHRALITAHLAIGNRGDAIREYKEYRQLLRCELGVAPSDQMVALVRGLQAS